jgi:hypothetical protein
MATKTNTQHNVLPVCEEPEFIKKVNTQPHMIHTKVAE